MSKNFWDDAQQQSWGQIQQAQFKEHQMQQQLQQLEAYLNKQDPLHTTMVSDKDLTNEVIRRGLVDKEAFEKLLIDTQVKRMQLQKEELDKKIAELIAKKMTG